MGSPFVHIEISAHDLDRARRFYETVFDWKIDLQPMPNEEMPYGIINTGKEPGGGLYQVSSDRPVDVTVYLGSGNLEESLRRIEAAGGRTMMPPTEVAGEGWFAIFADPEGNALGLWRPAEGSGM